MLRPFLIVLLSALLLAPAPAAGADPDAYLDAFRAYKEKDFDGAIEQFKRAIVENPENFMAYWWLANIYMEKRLYGKAKNIVSIADRIKLAPPDLPPEVLDDRRRLLGTERDYAARKARADEVWRQARKTLFDGKWGEGADLLRKAIEANPLEPKYYEALGDALRDQGETADACDAYLKASLLKPGDPRILKKMAAGEEKLDRKDERLETLRALYKVEPTPALAGQIRDGATARLATEGFRVLKRRGDTVYLNVGLRDGLTWGDEFKTKLRVVHMDRDALVNDLETGAPIALEDGMPVGDVTVVRFGETWSEARIVTEWNAGIRVGDELVWQKNRN